MAKFNKAVLKKEEFDGLDETLKPFYVQQGDSYLLDIDGNAVEEFPTVVGLKQAHTRLKTENTKLKNDLQATIDKYKDIDPEKARLAEKELQALKDKEQIDAGNIDEVIEKKTERMRADHANQITGFQTQIKEKDDLISTANARLRQLHIETAITRVLTSKTGKELGVVTQAIPDIIRRASDVFKLDEKTGQVLPYRTDGSLWYGKDPSQAMSMEEWLGLLKPDCPHYFGASGGAGADNGGGGAPKKKRSEMSAEEKSKYIKEHGQDKFFSLPA